MTERGNTHVMVSGHVRVGTMCFTVSAADLEELAETPDK